MFTGIVQALVIAKNVINKPGLKQFSVDLPEALQGSLAIGASIAIDGVCLTVTCIDHARVSFDVIDQTLAVTTIADVANGYAVNLERSARYGDEVGGHILSGHIDAVATIVDIELAENNKTVWYEIAPELQKYVFERGFVALNGCSLTVAKVNEKQQFAVCYIPETLRATTHGSKALGERVNLEIDRQTQAIVDTVERSLAAKNLPA